MCNQMRWLAKAKRAAPLLKRTFKNMYNVQEIVLLVPLEEVKRQREIIIQQPAVDHTLNVALAAVYNFFCRHFNRRRLV